MSAPDESRSQEEITAAAIRGFHAYVKACDEDWLLSDYSPSERRAWHGRRRYRQNQWRVQDALRDVLKLYPWTWFGHLTFLECARIDKAKGATRRLFHWVSRRAWGPNYYKHNDKGAFAFVAYERQKRGDWHVHFVAAETKDVDRFEAMDWWENRHGWSRIYLYDPTRGGGAYATKYATKEADGDWDAIGSWRGAEMPPQPRAHGEA